MQQRRRLVCFWGHGRSNRWARGLRVGLAWGLTEVNHRSQAHLRPIRARPCRLRDFSATELMLCQSRICPPYRLQQSGLQAGSYKDCGGNETTSGSPRSGTAPDRQRCSLTQQWMRRVLDREAGTQPDRCTARPVV